MKSLSETIYLKSPYWLQKVAINIYGYHIERIRHRGDYYHFLKKAIKHNSFDISELNTYCNQEVRKVIRSAAENVPYYRTLFERYGININDIRTSEDLQKIPLLEKETIRKDPLQFINHKYSKQKLLTIHTTGTTGTPLIIYCTKQVRQNNFAFFDRYLNLVGINPHGSRATLWGRIVLSSGQKKPPFWHYIYSQKNLLLSSYHLTDENILYYIEKLTSFRPDYIDAYPSSLYAIANYAREHGISLKNVTHGITTSAETLSPWQRDVIESVFAMPIFDQYGSAEMCVFVGQCKAGNYHIHSDYAIVEFLREDGTAATPGEEAELVCTGFINPVMPLIRYRIGDKGILSGKACTCGTPFPVMEGLLGRIDDVIVTPDGRRVGRLSPVFKGFPVKEVQYIQENKQSVSVNIVRADNYTSDTEKAVYEELRKRLGDVITIELSYVDKIARGSGGKLRAVISKVKEK
jgi:phenylacetate-CoA ligase